MAKRIKMHIETPHRDKIFELTDDLRNEAVALIPTDSQYALVCDYQNKKGMDRIRKIRQMGKKDHLSVMCHSLEHVSTFAHLNDDNFKLIKRLIPGPYTFILPATREVPRLLTHPKKRTVGIRVPEYQICLELIQEMGRPLMAITAKLKGVKHGHPDDGDRELFLSRFDKIVDVIVDNQEPLKSVETTILDLTDQPSTLLREGLGLERLDEALALETRELESTPSV